MSPYLSQQVQRIAEKKDYVILSEDTLVGQAAKVMRDKDISSVLVASYNNNNSNEPVGIVTEKDIVYHVLAECKGPFKIRLKDVMSSPLITVLEKGSIKDAVQLMRSKHIRRLAIRNTEGNITGVITLMSIVENIPDDNLTDPAGTELYATAIEQEERKMTCPYCGSEFKIKDEMSKHIDRIHIGSGLLEGDIRKWL
jgi:CBS domain-containing protein/DNA-directed RNA polymerase subunit RPC12/RpoP